MTEKRTWVGPSAPERLNILRNTRTIAIVGMSDKISRASNFVATYLLSSSPYTVYFVNPILAAKGKPVLGQPVYASLQDLPEVPDLVEIFRRNEDLPGVVQEAVDLGAKTVWMQLGSWNEEAAAIGEAAGLNVVMDRCVKIEHARFHGGLPRNARSRRSSATVAGLIFKAAAVWEQQASERPPLSCDRVRIFLPYRNGGGMFRIWGAWVVIITTSSQHHYKKL